MESAAPSPHDLYLRLRELYPLSDEKLAQKFGVGIKSILRLKANHGVEFDKTILLLDAAGWLNLNEKSSMTRAEAAELRREARAMFEAARRFLEGAGPS